MLSNKARNQREILLKYRNPDANVVHICSVLILIFFSTIGTERPQGGTPIKTNCTNLKKLCTGWKRTANKKRTEVVFERWLHTFEGFPGCHGTAKTYHMEAEIEPLASTSERKCKPTNIKNETAQMSDVGENEIQNETRLLRREHAPNH